MEVLVPRSVSEVPQQSTTHAAKRAGGAKGALTAAGALLMFLGTSPHSLEVPLPVHNHNHNTEALCESQLEELGSLLPHAPSPACVASLVSVIEAFDKLGDGPRERAHLSAVTAACRAHLRDTAQQDAALAQLSLLLRYRASLHTSHATTLARVVCLALASGALLPCAALLGCQKRRRKRSRSAGGSDGTASTARSWGSRGRPCACAVCAGRCVVGKELGSGGFGSAFAAHLDGRPCVLKMILVDLENDITQAQAALEEAKVLSKLQHPNVVAYHDVFLHRAATPVASEQASCAAEVADCQCTDYVCIVMELCDGGSLYDLCASRGVSLGHVLGFLHSAATGLEHLHVHKYIHRDVKPENVFVLNRPGDDNGNDSDSDAAQFKLGDFGLAWDAAQSACPTPHGTLMFMAPECHAKQWFDQSADIWSLGVTALEAVVGEDFASGLVADDAVRRAHSSTAALVFTTENSGCQGEGEGGDEDEDEDDESGGNDVHLGELALRDAAAWQQTHLPMLVGAFERKLQELCDQERAKRLPLEEEQRLGLVVRLLPRLVERMLAFEPSQRPAATEVKATIALLR